MPWNVLPVGTLTALVEATVDAQLGRPLLGVRAFMKGDGHRNPPFQWFNTCPRLQLHFQNLMFAEMLCAHVEEFGAICRAPQAATCQWPGRGRATTVLPPESS